MPSLCIIFDLDGTLVDSEHLCNQAMLDLLPGVTLTVDEMVLAYRGRKYAEIMRDLEVRFGVTLPADFERVYRSRVAQRFDELLEPTPGAREMLADLPHARCVASSGPRAKIEHALAVTGLAPFFGDRVYSAYEVGSWKPDPGLFLYAAQRMGFTPDRCVVIEDSDVGVQAARNASMRCLRYVPGASDTVDGQFARMAQLPALIAAFG